MMISQQSWDDIAEILIKLPTRYDYDSTVQIIQERGATGSDKIEIVQIDGIIYASKHVPCETIQVCFLFVFVSMTKLQCLYVK